MLWGKIMDYEKKLAFVHKQTKLALDHIQHMDSGGQIIASNPSAEPISGSVPSVNTNANTNNNGVAGFLGIGNNFQAQAANINPGTNAGQLNAAYQGAQNGINAQVGLANQFQPGVAQGVGTQGALSGQLAQRAAGQGPNPAQAALAQSTGQNIAATNAAIAGARGSNNNVGLLARQGAQTGAGIQQQAVGQAATLQAQQQIAAQQQQAQLAAQQVGQGTGAVTTLNQEQQNEQNILQGANTAANNAAVAMQGNINNANAVTAAGNAAANTSTLGSLVSGGGTTVLSLLNKGGMVKMDGGGNVLDANARNHISSNNFALPGRRYPIHDIGHARNALARVAQNGTPEEKNKVKGAVHKKYPSLAGKKMAEGGEVEFQPTQDESGPGPQVSSDAPSIPGENKKGGAGGAIGSLLALLAKGGEVKDGYLNAKRMAAGGYMAPTPLVVDGNNSAPQSFAGQWVNSNSGVSQAPAIAAVGNVPQASLMPQGSGKGAQTLISAFKKDSKGGEGGGDLGGAAAGANAGLGAGEPEMEYSGGLAAKGGNVKANSPSQKAVAKGDSLKNDKVPAMLSEGEVVMDRETLADKGPVGQMARAVAAHIAKRNKRK